MSHVPLRARAADQQLDPSRGPRRRLGPRRRKIVLTAHIVGGVGWLGAAYCVLVLNVLGARAAGPALRLGTYQAVHAFNWAVNIPLALTMLVTGGVLGLGTRFGLVRQRW